MANGETPPSKLQFRPRRREDASSRGWQENGSLFVASRTPGGRRLPGSALALRRFDRNRPLADP